MRRWAVIAVAAVATVACGGSSPGEQTTGSTIAVFDDTCGNLIQITQLG